MIHSVFELGDTLAREVMVPRTGRRLGRAATTPSTRRCGWPCAAATPGFPVHRGEHRRRHRGGLPQGPGPRARRHRDAEQDAVSSAVMRPAVFVPDCKRIDELLKEMQRTRNHMAIVVDEYGGTAGSSPSRTSSRRSSGRSPTSTTARSCPTSRGSTTARCGSPPGCPSKTCRSSTACSRRAATSTRAWPSCGVLEEADVDTVGGLLAQQLGRVPLPGAEAEVAGLHLLAEGGKDARGRVRITTVLITPVHADGRTERTRRRRSRTLATITDGPATRDAPALAGAEDSRRGDRRWPSRRPAARHRRRRGRGRPRHRRPHLRRGDRRAALAVADGAAGRGRRGGVQRRRRAWRRPRS